MATYKFPYVSPKIALRDHDYCSHDHENHNQGQFLVKQNQGVISMRKTQVQQPIKTQTFILPNNVKNGDPDVNDQSSSVSIYKEMNFPGIFSICLPVSQPEPKISPTSEISLCLLSQNGESTSLLTPGWKDGQSKCAKTVKTLIEDFDKHIKNPKYHFSVMERYISEVFQIASKAITKDPQSPHKILIEPCLLSLRAIAKIYTTRIDFSFQSSKYYFMFLLEKFKFIRKEVTKIQATQNN